MSRKTFIEWCHSTWSPWLGCSKISLGCKNCYITATTPFRTRKLKHGEPRQRTSESYWKQPLRWNREAIIGHNTATEHNWDHDSDNQKPIVRPDHSKEQYPVLNDIHIPKLDWLIVGGESGPKSRPCSIGWIRAIVAQCKAAGVPCFVKQMGSNAIEVAKMQGDPLPLGWCRMTGFADKDYWKKDCRFKHPKGGDPEEWPNDLRVREFPKL